MKLAIQPGAHPDAEMLTAFAEQVVSEKEREEIVAHLAGCNRCREVVFLAQQAEEVEMPALSAHQAETRASGGGWFAGWKLFWIPVAALAGIGGIAVLTRMDRASAPEARMAQNVPPPQMTDSMAATKATSKAEPTAKVPRDDHEQMEKAEASKRRERDVVRREADARLDRKLLDEEDKAVAKKDETAKEADSLRAAAPDVSAVHGAAQGTGMARAKSSAIGGPMMQNQIQQQNSNLQQNYANEAPQSGASVLAANNPEAAQRQATSASQTVAVEAASGIVPASPAPAAAPVLAQVQSESVIVSGKKLAKLKGASVVLPSKLGVLSSANAGKRVIAIDTGGSVFVSGDAGKSWQAVPIAWSGRAVLVSSRPALAGRAGTQKTASPQFVLITDKSESWVSEDGKQWTLETPADK